jgi:hypothetical protein
LQLNAGDNSSEKVLSGKTDNDSDDARTREKALELGFSVIAEAEDKQKSDEENQEGKDLAQNVRNGGLPLLLEVEVPEIMVRESDDESRTKQDQRGANVLAPIGLDAINGDGGIEREGETEGLEEQSKRHLRAPFEKATESECDEVGEDKRDGGGGSALRANEGLNHRHPILPINRQRNKREGNTCPFWPIPEVYKRAAPRPAVHEALFFFRGEVVVRHPLGRGAKNSQAQPARKQSPPSGVIAPSQRMFVNAIVYKLPLKRRTPAQNSQQAPRLVVPKKARNTSTMA